MDAETFVKISGLLNITAEDVARESGYSLGTIKAARIGARSISPALEQFMLDKLRAASGDKAIQLVLKVCEVKSLLDIVKDLFTPSNIAEKVDAVLQHKYSKVVLAEADGHTLSLETLDGWKMYLSLDGYKLPQSETSMEYALYPDELTPEDLDSFCSNTMPRKQQIDMVFAPYISSLLLSVINNVATSNYGVRPGFYEALLGKLS